MTKFNIDKLREICSLKEKQFKRFGKYDKRGRYIFKDNGSKILGVAHLDTVAKYTHCEYLKMPHREVVFSPTLDDRLGAFLLLDHLPKLGIKFDILLTTDEEIGRSTADLFETDKQYNWIFQFDRAGSDVVMYDYETPELKKTLEKLGWKVGDGSFTDISSLQHLDCKGFNFGVCYEDYHSYDAYADLTNLYKSVEKFKTFYDKHKDILLPHKESNNSWCNRTYSIGNHGYSDEYDTSLYETDAWNDSFGPPRHNHDIWNYTCCSCHKYISLDLDANEDELAYDAAEEGYCRQCYSKYIYEITQPTPNFFH